MYYFIEQPFRKYKPKTSQKKLKSLAFYLFATVIIDTIGCSTYFSQGWLWRLPNTGQNLIEKVTDSADYHRKHFGGIGFPYPGWTYNNGSNQAQIILLGNSHAQALQYGMCEAIAKPYNIVVYMAGTSCLPLPDFTRMTPGVNWNVLCPHTLNIAIEQLLKTDDSILVLTDSWFSQLSLAGKLSTGNKLDINLDSHNYNDYSDLTDALDKLRALIGNRKLVIIGGVPGAGIADGFSCLTRPLLAQGNCLKFLNRRNIHYKRVINVNTVLEQYVKQAKDKKIYFINPFDVFCCQKNCISISKDGLPFYSNQFHLSKTGSLYFIFKIKNKLLDIIKH